AEQRVWDAVEEVLRQPEIIAEEVRRQQAHAGQQRAEVLDELALFEKALAKCGREEQRWAHAYANEVISIEELKQYRAEIAIRRQSVLAQRAELQAKLEALANAVDHIEALTGYCTRVCQQLHAFDVLEKRQALESLDIRVTWTPGEPLVIEGNIPLG